MKGHKLEMIVLPNLDWYLGVSNRLQLSPRCPYASVYRCPRFFQSLSLLGDAGSTRIDPYEDDRLKQSWEKTDIWPVTAEQATSISGPGDEIRHFARFCPEVSFDHFGLFATELHKYADEIDVGSAHQILLREQALSDDWRWSWSHIEPMHYTECALYSLLNLGKGKDAPKPTFPNIGLPDSITTHTVSVTEADNLTANDVDDLIMHMYEHPEIKAFEVYYREENPHLKKAIDDFKISSNTVEMHYYKDPDHDLSFIKVHKNTTESDWEKHLIASSPMYFKRVISLTERQRKKMEMQENQTIWDKVLRHPVYVIMALLGSIASIIGLLYVFLASDAIDQDAKLESSPGSTVYQAERDILIKQEPPSANESHQHQLVQPTKKKELQSGQQEINHSDDPFNGDTSLSESGLYNEEHIRSRISVALTSANATEAIALLKQFRTEKARREEAKHIFDYCIKNNKLKEADKVVSFLSPAEKEQAKQLVEIEKMKGESK